METAATFANEPYVVWSIPHAHGRRTAEDITRLMIVPTSTALTLNAGVAGKLIRTVARRVLALAMTTRMLIGLVVLTETTESTGTIEIIAALSIFGFGAGLALPALTDTVMAAVAERDAGAGSTFNDFSRQLGGALGVAVIGSFVSNTYRINLDHALGGKLPASVVHRASSSMGVPSMRPGRCPRG